MAALAGLTTLIVEVEGKSGLGSARSATRSALTYQEAVLVAGRRTARRRPTCGPGRSRPTTPSSSTSRTTACAGSPSGWRRAGPSTWWRPPRPGIKDILVLGKVKQLERAAASGVAGAPDFLVLDAPAAGHAVTFLMSARGCSTR